MIVFQRFFPFFFFLFYFFASPADLLATPSPSNGVAVIRDLNFCDGVAVILEGHTFADSPSVPNLQQIFALSSVVAFDLSRTPMS